MKAVLILKKIYVENANAISGFTYGFPSVTHFLGFMHALSRKLALLYPKLKFKGCAVISHHQQIHKYSPNPGQDAIFCLTRNPATKEGDPAPFIEEGRMHMTISLMIECEFQDEDLTKGDGQEALIEKIKQLAPTQRLAGGIILKIHHINFSIIPQDYEQLEKFTYLQMRQMLPGYILIDRSELLATASQNKETFNAWLDFFAIKSQASSKQEKDTLGEENVIWKRLPKPSKGYLVPIMVGYRAISDLYHAGKVANARDQTIPFRFVEAAHSVGQWLSLYRVKDLTNIFWHYHALPEEGWYLCKNDYSE